MTDIIIVSTQLINDIRSISNEEKVTNYLNKTFNDLRVKGVSDLELVNLINLVHAQLHSLDPVSVDDSIEWNMIIHAKVELFRIGSKLSSKIN
jgi:hypothetical protein